MDLRIFQVIDALDYGDAVSNHCIELHRALNNLGYSTQIYSKFSHEKVAEYRESFEKIKIRKQDIIIFHFSGKSLLVNELIKLNCKKILIYHNITPHFYFDGMEPHFSHCMEGREQLQELSGKFDVYLGDSQFNVEELKALGCSPCEVLPIVVDLEVKKDRKELALLKKGRAGEKFIFVGRVAPNKKHEDILKVFDYFYTYINPNAELYLIGNYNDYLPYYNKLTELSNRLASKKNIFFTGKVSEEELDFHYKSADVFLSMSEHEGFCVPLLESMSYGLPTFAFDAGAIRSTMGPAGIKLKSKDAADIAELIYYVLEDKELRTKIVANQYDWLNHFSGENTIKTLKRVIEQVK
ncbi:GDP-mannose-dependent alpha-(1-6)-phosphatidylinositol monomannoside mannosyltransferase [compost metagenome]